MTGADGEGPLMAGNIPKADWSRREFERMIDWTIWPSSMSRADRIASIDAAWHAHILGERSKPDMADEPRCERFARDIAKAITGDAGRWRFFQIEAYAAMNVADRESGRGIMGELEREDEYEIVGWRARDREGCPWNYYQADQNPVIAGWRIVEPLVVAPLRTARPTDRSAGDPPTPIPTTGSGAKAPPANLDAERRHIAMMAATLIAGRAPQLWTGAERSAVQDALKIDSEARRVIGERS